jgi:hypothetical protein
MKRDFHRIIVCFILAFYILLAFYLLSAPVEGMILNKQRISVMLILSVVSLAGILKNQRWAFVCSAILAVLIAGVSILAFLIVSSPEWLGAGAVGTTIDKLKYIGMSVSAFYVLLITCIRLIKK